MDIRTEQAMPKGIRQLGIDLEALDALRKMSQAISGDTGSRANLHD
jgi:hypothetical protein